MAEATSVLDTGETLPQFVNHKNISDPQKKSYTSGKWALGFIARWLWPCGVFHWGAAPAVSAPADAAGSDKLLEWPVR